MRGVVCIYIMFISYFPNLDTTSAIVYLDLFDGRFYILVNNFSHTTLCRRNRSKELASFFFV